MFSAIVPAQRVPPPAAGSRDGVRGSRRPLVEGRAVEAYAPRAAGQTPTRARTRLDLPEAEGPITPKACPARIPRVRSRTTRRPVPGGAIPSPSTVTVRVGAGNPCGCASAGRLASRSERRCHACRVATKLFQWATASSAGASARETRMEEAMITPALASPRITSHAPSARTPDCSIARNTLAAAPNPRRCRRPAGWRR